MSEFDDRSESLEDDRVDDDDNDDDGGGSVRPYLYEPMAEAAALLDKTSSSPFANSL